MGLEAFSLNGKIALITGGGTGIGLGIATAFINAGAKVIIVGRREELLQQACLELGNNSAYEVFDLIALDEIPELVKMIESKYGTLNILVNNAGIHLKKWAKDTTSAEFAHIIHTNLLSVFALTREVAKIMAKEKGGSIIFISSMSGLFGIDRVSAYGTSKTALIGLMNNLVTEYSKENIRINCIAPGWIESDMFLKAVESDIDRKNKIQNRIAMASYGKTEDIGNAAVYLTSDAGRYVTGIVLPVDGGAAVNF